MATFEIKMPKLGESITEGTILSWSVKVGDHVEEDDTLFEVSTAKVSAEIPSPVAGEIQEILFQEGDTVAVGTVVATIRLEEEEDNEPENASDEPETSAPTARPSTSGQTESSPSDVKDASEKKPQEREKEAATPEFSAADTKENAAGKSEESRWYSPVVLQLAKEAGLSTDELDQIPGSGYQGRLSKKDIKAYIEDKKSGKPVSNTPTKPSKPAAHPEKTPDQTVAFRQNTPQSPAASATSPASSSSPASQETAAPQKDSAPQATGDTSIEMDRVRRVIADHMVMSKKTSPHVTSVIEVDVTPLVKWRAQTKEEFFRQTGVKLTYLPAITEATARALREFPQVNASVEGYRIILKKSIHIGIAVSLPDGNLIVPVIRDADRLNLTGLASTIDSLAQKARANKLGANDIQGGTFTITNFGTFKTLFGTPVINQPEVAILAVGYVEKKPAVIQTPEGDALAIRHKMYLSLSYDHRIIDGALAGSFLRRIGDILENWKG